ncbi:MAG: M23 family metallopeptidase [Rhodospirillaceae bacterium]|nr:M23 family metallopeptidase [Rhodospirillaceae bacterium]
MARKTHSPIFSAGLLGVVWAMVIVTSAHADVLHLAGRVEQGGLVLGQATAGDRVYLDEEEVPVDAKGHFALGFARDAAPQAILKTVDVSGVENRRFLEVLVRDWPVQRIDGLPQKKVSPPPELMQRIKSDSQLIRKIREVRRLEADYLSGFVVPVKGVVSGVFGAQRILNGIPKTPHSGLDLAAPSGTPVAAAADGVVSLAHPDMFYTGKTVMIDHGLGVQTVYAHLSRIDVKIGQRVRGGQPIGAVGDSGRATGPHLHYGLSWLNRRLDPERVPVVLPFR